MLIGPLGTNFSEIKIKIQIVRFTKMHLTITSAKWRPFWSVRVNWCNSWTFSHITCVGHICWYPTTHLSIVPNNSPIRPITLYHWQITDLNHQWAVYSDMIKQKQDNIVHVIENLPLHTYCCHHGCQNKDKRNWIHPLYLSNKRDHRRFTTTV